MRGYFTRINDQNLYYSLLQSLPSVLSTSNTIKDSDISYFRLGQTLQPIPQNEQHLIQQQNFYTSRCRGDGAPVCDNQESRLQLALEKAADGAPGDVTIIFTDLFLSDREVQAQALRPFSAALTRFLHSPGTALGVIGLRSQFDGVVTDLPTGNYQHPAPPTAKKRPPQPASVGYRPAFALILGPQAAVDEIIAKTRLIIFPNVGPDDLHSSIISLSSAPPPSMAANFAPTAQPNTSTGVPEFTLRLPSRIKPADETTAGSFRLQTPLSAEPEFTSEAWSSPPGRCEWTRFVLGSSEPVKVEKINQNQWKLTLPQPAAPSPQAITLRPDTRYLLRVSMKARMVEELDWMTAWDLPASNVQGVINSRPAFFPALNLGMIRQLILGLRPQKLNDDNGTILGSAVFTIKVER